MRRFGDFLLALGLVVGIGAIVGYELDIIPTLPPAVLKLILYKLVFVGGVGLLAGGAFIRRLANRIEAREAPASPGTTEYNDPSQSAFPPPPASDVLASKKPIRDKPPSTL